jgi:hypothetical protein
MILRDKLLLLIALAIPLAVLAAVAAAWIGHR